MRAAGSPSFGYCILFLTLVMVFLYVLVHCLVVVFGIYNRKASNNNNSSSSKNSVELTNVEKEEKEKEGEEPKI